MGRTFLRTVVLYISVIVAMRIMGKRTLGEMHPTELVVSIMISDLATVPMGSEDTPLTDGIVPIFTLVVLEIAFAFLILKSRIIRRILVGHSCHVVRDGKIMENEIGKLRVTVEDIEEQIRINGYSSLTDISEIVIETNGEVSVIPKEAGRVPYLIVSDGKIHKKEMQLAKITERQIEQELEKRGIAHVKNVLYMSGLNSKIIHTQEKGEARNI